jgi:SAM-dependent methyltransferase
MGGHRRVSGEIDPNADDCPACGERALVRWRSAHSSEPEISRRSSYELLRCAACGTATLQDPEGEPAELYERGTYSEPGARWRPLAGLARRMVTWDRRRMLGPLPPAARVLEVGAGRGELLADLSGRGHEAIGIEPGAAAGAVARSAGVEVSPMPLERFEREPASSDRIVLWHVLEHLERPLTALERMRPWLAPEGRLIVAVPDLDSLQARMGGDRWFHQDVPRHRTQFTGRGLERLLRRAGYEPRGRRRPLIDQNPLGMWLTLLNRLTTERDVPFRFLKGSLSYEHRGGAVRDATLTAVAGPLLLAAALPMELAATAAGRGGTVVLEAAPDGAGTG